MISLFVTIIIMFLILITVGTVIDFFCVIKNRDVENVGRYLGCSILIIALCILISTALFLFVFGGN